MISDDDKNKKNLILGVCGGIAAYKAVELASSLTKAGINVHTIMTANACMFVTPLTFRTITGNPVITDMFSESSLWNVMHISLAEIADLIAVVPATANIIGKVAAGIADDMLTTTIMASHSTVFFVPAMNSAMYENPIVQNNIKALKEIEKDEDRNKDNHNENNMNKVKYLFMEPDEGRLACGTSGKGRLPSPQDIHKRIIELLSLRPCSQLYGKKVLVTAGPTREPIDPVRYLSNRSSGKMGFALANEAARRGAEVFLVHGPTTVQPPEGIRAIRVETAQQMLQVTLANITSCDVAIFAAAVADYRPVISNSDKIRKSKAGSTFQIELTENPDIAKLAGEMKGDRIHVGFCADKGELKEIAVEKMKKKNFDLIAANDISRKDAGFDSDTNEIMLYRKDGSEMHIPMMPKQKVAKCILDEVERLF
ncbi:MAG: bifunctional phosphopantothenoylcysteine decarboxylase/phosphopantothenate--cysteine ligase CoaBC [Clostridiales bacterium]|nr:bifunctional phosphopantothenoylcysteine decarboxylase/phosphopantothenate--cysteine ligase CoaBC [Clostridiales bacterium]